MPVHFVRTSLMALVAVTMLANGASAALAPEYDRARQFATVASDGDVASALAEHGLIDRIEWMENLTYRVWSQNCFVVVTLSPVLPEQGMVGPTNYDPVPGAVVCE